MTDEDRALIARLKKLDAAAKKGPWYPQGQKSRDRAIYRIAKPEEDLIIALRNHIGDLLRIIETQERR